MSETDPAHLAGKVVGGRYRVAAFVTLGTTVPGAVYEADDAGTMVALKVLLPEIGQRQDNAARFEREAKALGLLVHPNIVQLRDTGTLEDGTPYIVTELVRGRSLREVLDEGPLEPKRALAIVLEILNALGHAHAVGVIHRDLKPENILIDEAGGVKLVDFGVAKLVADTLVLLGATSLTQAGTSVLGAPQYMAPEIASGQPVDARGDLYATGVLLFEMIAGKPPFVAPTAAAVMRMHATESVPALGQPAAIELLVAEALQKKPELRYQSAAEMIAATRTALQALEPMPSWPAPPAEAPPTPLTPSRSAPLLSPILKRRVAIGGAAAVSGIVVIALIASRCGKSPPAVAKPDVAHQASELLAHGDAAGAVDLLEVALANTSTHLDARTYLLLGHARLQLGRRIDAIGAYENAILLDRTLGGDTQLRSDLTKLLDKNEAISSVLALEILATGVDPPARDTIIAQASTGKLPEVRHRAFAIAERLHVTDSVDRIESWSLDLRQAATCDERRLAVLRLRGAGDKRALAVLRKAQSQFACIAKDAGDAITYLASLP